MLTSSDVARLAVEHAVIRLDDAREQPLLVDAFRLVLRDRPQHRILASLIEWLEVQRDSIDVVVGASTASFPLTTLAATMFGLPMAYVRLRRKTHGKQRQVEGNLPAGARALLLFDLIPDADVLRAVVEIVEGQGAHVALCAGLVASDLEAAERALHSRSIPVLALTTLDEVRKVGEAPASVGAPGPSDPPASVAPPVPATSPGSADARQTREAVARILLEIGAVSINATSPFRYASGILSPIYTDNRLLISHPRHWTAIVDAYCRVLSDTLGVDERTALAGAPTAGVPHAIRVAERLQRPVVFVESGDDGDTVYGSLDGISRVIVVEDLVTTGKSVLEFTGALRGQGVAVDACVAIFTYDPERAARVFEHQGMRFAALCDLATLLDVAVRDGQITAQDRAAVEEWLRDPNEWTRQSEQRLAASVPRS